MSSTMSLLPGPGAAAAAGSRANHLQEGPRAFLRSNYHAPRNLVNSRRRALYLISLLVILLLLLSHKDDAVSVHLRDLGYITRPLWDKPPERFKNVIKLNSDDSLWRGLDSDDHTTAAGAGLKVANVDFERICEAHSLKHTRNRIVVPKVYDVIIFSVELDLLEIRMRELYNIVDYFVVVESNITFSGDIKPFIFQEDQNQFHFAKDKIIYRTVTDLNPSTFPSNKLQGGEKGYNNKNNKEDPFENEIKMRVGVSKIIDSLNPAKNDIIMQSDVDEIPSFKAVSLFKYCSGYPDIIHLGMPSYLYSFEFPMERRSSASDNSVVDIDINNGEGAGPRQWRASAKKYGTSTYNGYSHSRQSDTILENAGWHLTFAFRYIDDFIFKMR